MNGDTTAGLFVISMLSAHMPLTVVHTYSFLYTRVPEERSLLLDAELKKGAKIHALHIAMSTIEPMIVS